jgi:hypothetical protein
MFVEPGLYRHYKGNDYQVFQVVTHSETREKLVVYRCLYGDCSWWVRPLAMFLETIDIDIDGAAQPRFKFVRPMTAADMKLYPAMPWDFSCEM